MSRAVNWVLLQLAMSYYGDSLKEFQVENDQIFLSFTIFSIFETFMKLLTQFSIPKPIMADLARTNKNSKKNKKTPN